MVPDEDGEDSDDYPSTNHIKKQKKEVNRLSKGIDQTDQEMNYNEMLHSRL